MILKPAYIVLATGFLVLFFNSGARFAIGLVLYPMEIDLGWSRTALSATVTVFMTLSALSLPFTGRFVDKIGARRVLSFGVVVSAVALVLMGFIEEPWHALVFYGVLLALGSAATSITPISVLLAQWYPNRMGMANSIAISGMGCGQLLVIAVLATYLTELGWRGCFIVLGVASVVCVLPMVLWTGSRQPPPDSPATAGDGTAVAPDGEGRVSTVLRNRRFWVLLVIYIICGFQDFFVATHIVAFALDEGVSSSLAGNMLAFMGLAGLVGVLLAGALNDRVGPHWPTALCFALRVVVFGLAFVVRDHAIIVTVALLYGVTFRATAPLTVVFARQFGSTAVLGTVAGLITLSHHLAGGIGALYGARVFDASGSYDEALLALTVMSFVALGLTPWVRQRTTPIRAN